MRGKEKSSPPKSIPSKPLPKSIKSYRDDIKYFYRFDKRLNNKERWILDSLRNGNKDKNHAELISLSTRLLSEVKHYSRVREQLEYELISIEEKHKSLLQTRNELDGLLSKIGRAKRNELIEKLRNRKDLVNIINLNSIKI